jgi:hypothetical protein
LSAELLSAAHSEGANAVTSSVGLIVSFKPASILSAIYIFSLQQVQQVVPSGDVMYIFSLPDNKSKSFQLDDVVCV